MQSLTMQKTKTDNPVLIAGGGIGGLVTALTLDQIGVKCLVLESVADLKPLGVGINLQPNAVRELYDLGLDDSCLDKTGIQTREWALVGLNGNDIYSEPRGLDAGYKWPQYSVHRGELQMLLYHTALERLGKEALILGKKVTGYRNDSNGNGVTAHVEDRHGRTSELQGSLLIAADGLHSAVRQCMYPDQAPIHWGGAIMWRGTSPGVPIRTNASFVGLGMHDHRFVFYPISAADPVTGLATINWIAEITVDNSDGWANGDWNRQVALEEFIHHFEDWNYDWLDVPDLIRKSAAIYEYPMIDREPVPSWQDGCVALLGDAAHVMYPVGSNGASQAIIDARVLGACMLEHGVSREALAAYDRKLCKEVSALVLRNRGSGPFGILNIVEDRCGGIFDNIDDVIDKSEIDDFMARYKAAAGFAIESLNSAAPTILPGSRIRS
jgi:2-polyprenyl-6-methoxyphenol hydroxylase-like FAD-dependent oxidoreductase